MFSNHLNLLQPQKFQLRITENYRNNQCTMNWRIAVHRPSNLLQLALHSYCLQLIFAKDTESIIKNIYINFELNEKKIRSYGTSLVNLNFSLTCQLRDIRSQLSARNKIPVRTIQYFQVRPVCKASPNPRGKCIYIQLVPCVSTNQYVPVRQ